MLFLYKERISGFLFPLHIPRQMTRLIPPSIHVFSFFILSPARSDFHILVFVPVKRSSDILLWQKRRWPVYHPRSRLPFAITFTECRRDQKPHRSALRERPHVLFYAIAENSGQTATRHFMPSRLKSDRIDKFVAFLSPDRIRFFNILARFCDLICRNTPLLKALMCFPSNETSTAIAYFLLHFYRK